MAFDQTTRNRLNRFVADARKLLANEFTRQLQAIYGMNPVTGDVADIKTLMGLTPSQQESAQLLRDTFQHYLVNGEKGKEKERKLAALDRIVREQAFTVLNRIAALRMSEARGFLIESIANGYESKGFQLFHRIAGISLGETGDAYRHYLFRLFDEFSLDLSVLFDRFSAQGRLFPSTPVLIELLNLVNDDEVAPLWAEDETIGWIYQYFNSQEERKKMRDASQAPRNSRELAVRNQFFTPRYVVEFLTDNTLGRIWYEMTKGKTALVDECEYLVRRPNEIFIEKSEQAPELEVTENLSHEELLKQTVYIEHRELKDPREIRMLDPACGSMHFGLYCFDLFERIYDEAWEIEVRQGADSFIREVNKQSLTETYPDKTEFLKHVPRLIIENNIHGVDIDPRAAQVAGLSLWQRAHNSWQQAGIKPQLRPQILKSNIVCAEPMPGEKELLQEFTSTLKPTVLGQLVEIIFDKMQLAGEIGSLLKIEEEIQEAITEARTLWQQKNKALSQFPDLHKAAKNRGDIDFDISDVDGDSFWLQVEQKILDALSEYASIASSLTSGQKRLFATDAARGFAFIDLCKKRFDVLLMNPPFGDIIGSSASYIIKNYKNHCNNIISSFITRSSILLNEEGKMGAIFDKTVSIKSSYKKIRHEYLFGPMSLNISSDMGWGVLDQAQVETVVCTFNKGTVKEPLLNVNIDHVNGQSQLLDVIPIKNVEKIPNFALSLNLPSKVLNMFGSHDCIEPIAAVARQGLGISDSWRWYRAKAEVPIGSIGSNKHFAWLANGGGYSPFFRDSDLVLNWNSNGYAIKATEAAIYGSSSRTVKNVQYYFAKGLSFPKRTEVLNAHALPSGHIFTVEGLGCFPVENADMWHTLALMNSQLFGYLINTFCGQHKHVGYIKQLPFSIKQSKELSLIAKEIFKIKRIWAEFIVNTAFFRGPILLYVNDLQELLESEVFLKIDSNKSEKGIENKLISAKLLLEKSNYQIESLTTQLNELVYKAYDVDPELEVFILNNSVQQSSHTLSGISNISDVDLLFNSDVLEYILGISLGYYTNTFEQNYYDYNLVFEVSPPNILPSVNIGPNIGQDIICTSEENDQAIISKVISDLCHKMSCNKEFFVENLCKALNVSSIREYLNSTNMFFESHLKKYSKSRRLSPIYWPLQTTTGSFTIWVCYHKINNQTLMKCVNDFVEPKLETISSELNGLKSDSTRKALDEKKIDKLTTLKIELEDYRDELLRVAKHWQPNLDDGVQITAAPLWRLFQHKNWKKKLKETSEKLDDGDYDWAHLAFSIWPERVLKKCHGDRSLAIAHNVENDLWHEVEVIKPRRKEPVWEWQPKSLTDSELRNYIKNKISTDDQLKLYRTNKTNENGGANEY